MTGEPTVILELPSSLREALREPLGTVYPTIETALEPNTGPIIAVGDVVVASLLVSDNPPAVAIVDGRTKRQAVREVIETELLAALEDLPQGRTVPNPPGTLTLELLEAVADAVRSSGGGTAVIDVEGEEDLATLPAVVAAPDGAAVIYGQPDEGVVVIDVTSDRRRRALSLLRQFDGDVSRMERVLGVSDAHGE